MNRRDNTNALTNVTLYAYDVAARKTNEISGGAVSGTFVPLTTNRFSFTAAGDLATLTDGNNHKTTWKHDLYGQVTNKVDHLNGNAFFYGYDANGRLLSRASPAKGTTAYGYDAVGSLTNVNYPVTADLALKYDSLNRLTNLVTTGVLTNNYTYTAWGALASEDGPWPDDTVSYSYVNRLRSGLSINSQPSTLNISYGWDSTKRLTNVTSGAGSFGYSYRASQPTLVNRVALPYGHYETNTFDALGRLTGTALATSGNAVMNDHAYTLNVGNQRITQARNGVGYANTVDYKYDALGQLLTAVGKESGGTGRLQEQMGYAYDAGGNLKSRTNNALIQTFTVDALNQLTNVSRTGTLTVAGSTTHPATSVTVNSLTASLYTDTTFARAGFAPVDGTNTYTAIAQDSYSRLDTNAISVWLPTSATYSYDLNGNLTFDGRKAFEYDDENQLVRVTRTNEWKTEFVYDGKMRMRIKKEFAWSLGSGVWVLGSETRYVYDGMLVVQERDANNVAQVSYTRGRDLSGSFEGAGGIGGLLARSSIPEMLNPSSQSLLSITFYHADGNGNITALMSTNGLIVAWYQYDAYGRTLAQSGPLAEANCYRFSSKAWQEKAGLYYYGYRFYTPELQRWVNRDPIGERGGINLYQFVKNSPIALHDPSGLLVAEITIIRHICNWHCPRSVGSSTLQEVKEKGLSPSDVAGGGNAFMHCVAACRAAQKCGVKSAKDFWDGREGPGSDERKKNGDADSDMDLANNAVGYGITGDCWKGCADAWQQGNLTCLDFQLRPIPCNGSSMPPGL